MQEIVFDIDRLRGIAAEQYGFVTTSQAEAEGVTKHSLSMLAKRGRIERVAHGVYRVPQFAPTGLERFALALLWTGDADAVLSHETALDAYGVCDVNPTKIHVTAKRRIRRSGGDGYALHRQDLEKSQIGWWEELPIVKLPTAIEQCIVNGTPTYLILQAVENGVRRGMLSENDSERLRKMVEEQG